MSLSRSRPGTLSRNCWRKRQAAYDYYVPITAVMVRRLDSNFHTAVFMAKKNKNKAILLQVMDLSLQMTGG